MPFADRLASSSKLNPIMFRFKTRISPFTKLNLKFKKTENRKDKRAKIKKKKIMSSFKRNEFKRLSSRTCSFLSNKNCIVTKFSV